MAQIIADKRDIDFVVYEQLDGGKLPEAPKYKGQTSKMYDMVLNEAKNLGLKVILPTWEEGDRTGLRFENNSVKMPECFRQPWELIKEGEWIAMTEDPAVGGQGLPFLITQAVHEYIIGTNFALTNLAVICHGAAKMVELYGTEKQKQTYLKKLYSGEWGGTMVLTEPDAGSDLGALTTSAVKNEDGSYSISGNKIFITYGEHDLAENIVYPVLARIEGSPEGVGGISIFLVSKYQTNGDGKLGERNDVVCTAIEEKMGLHASPTCQLTFGGKSQCRGELLGEINKGMQVMFHMMNEARLEAGALGLYNASHSYLYALNYARERIQGRDLGDRANREAKGVALINHPDVRRMLLWMKSHTEGMRSLVYYAASLLDHKKCAEDEESRSIYHDLVELLTPVIKSYCTDRGFDAVVQAMQIYGGYGYTMDYPIEQIMRDAKINSIYEGANGIQAMDLLGRKMGMKGGKVFAELLSLIQKTISDAKATDLEGLSSKLETALNKFQETAKTISTRAISPDFKAAFASASPFLEVMGDILMGWMLLGRATAAKPALNKIVGTAQDGAYLEIVQNNKNAAFYDGQLKSAQYFMEAILPVTSGKMDSIIAGAKSIVDIPESAFGS